MAKINFLHGPNCKVCSAAQQDSAQWCRSLYIIWPGNGDDHHLPAWNPRYYLDR